jgi:transposase
VRDLSCGDTRIFLQLEVRRLDCRNCGRVKSERLDFLADNPHYTKRFAYYVGRRCRSATIKDVAADLRLDYGQDPRPAVCKPSLRERAGLVRR